jgi:protein-L-isoaspartate(D-aspartate) O-methyltransferase
MKKSTLRFAALSLALASLALAGSCTGKSQGFAERREEMVRTQIAGRGIAAPTVLKAFREVPREEFVLPEFRDHAYDDVEAPLGFGQSLDRPYENALMILALGIGPGDKVLEVGTGSGYLSALLSRIAKDVYTIEIEPDIAAIARRNFEKLGYANIHPKVGDGFVGWPEFAPFDAIVLTCSPDEVPKPLADQLAEGGRLLLPLGGTEKFQELVLYEKKGGKFTRKAGISPTEFVPMKGKVLERKDD